MISEDVLADIRSTIKNGMALGNDRFKQEIETLTGRLQHKEQRGQPKTKQEQS